MHSLSSSCISSFFLSTASSSLYLRLSLKLSQPPRNITIFVFFCNPLLFSSSSTLYLSLKSIHPSRSKNPQIPHLRFWPKSYQNSEIKLQLTKSKANQANTSPIQSIIHGITKIKQGNQKPIIMNPNFTALFVSVRRYFSSMLAVAKVSLSFSLLSIYLNVSIDLISTLSLSLYALLEKTILS